MVGRYIGLPCALFEGKLVSIESATVGKKGYLCPACKKEVFARKGKKIAHHFAHGPHSQSWCTGHEAAWHHLAKEILIEEGRFRIPDLYDGYARPGYDTVFVHDGRAYFIHRLAMVVKITADTVALVSKIRRYTPDILIEAGGSSLLVAISLDGLYEQYCDEYEQVGISVVGLDLGKLGRMPTKEEFVEILCDGQEYKRWLHHRKITPLSQIIRAWEVLESEQKLVIYAPEGMYVRGQALDAEASFRRFEIWRTRREIVEQCPLRGSTSGFRPSRTRRGGSASIADCSRCSFFCGIYELRDSAIGNLTEEGVMCRAPDGD